MQQGHPAPKHLLCQCHARRGDVSRARGSLGATAVPLQHVGAAGGLVAAPSQVSPWVLCPGMALSCPRSPGASAASVQLGSKLVHGSFTGLGTGSASGCASAPAGGGCGNPGGLHPQQELIWCLRSSFCLLLPLARVQPHAHACRAAVDTAPAPGCAPTALQARLCDPLQHLGFIGGRNQASGGVQP